MRRSLLLLISMTALVCACGRSTGQAGPPTRVSVGLLTAASTPLTVADVNGALSRFAFQLEELSAQPQCTATQCQWIAEGVMPERMILKLRGHKDSRVVVLFADPVGSSGKAPTTSAPVPR